MTSVYQMMAAEYYEMLTGLAAREVSLCRNLNLERVLIKMRPKGHHYRRGFFNLRNLRVIIISGSSSSKLAFKKDLRT